MPIDPAYVAKLAALSDQDRIELLGRLILWRSAVSTTEQLLDIAVRMREYAERDDKETLFPTTHDAYQIADHLPLLAAVVFSTMGNWGQPAPGAVGSNKGSQVQELRTSVEQVAFPDQTDLEEFRRLRDKLKNGRDKMIAHVDGTAFNLTHGAITLLWPISAAVQYADIEPWRTSIGPLGESLSAHDWLIRGGEAAKLAADRPILSGKRRT